MSLLQQIQSRPALRKATITHDASKPSLGYTLEISDQYDRKVLQANIENWAEVLSSFTPKTIFVPLSSEHAQLLFKSYTYLEKHPEIVQAAAAVYVKTESFSDCITQEEEILVQQLGPLIQKGMEALDAPDGCFMKLSSRSPKDAAALSGVFERYYRQSVLTADRKLKKMSENDTVLVLCQSEGAALHFKDPKSIIRALILSERVWQDLTLAFRHPNEWNMSIVLRKWEPVPIDLEFRTFISDGRMTAISQYAYQLFSQRLTDPPQLSQALAAIDISFKSMRDLLSSKGYVNYVLDFGVIPPSKEQEAWRATLIEMNPFEETTDGALFSWNDERDLLEGKKSDVQYPVVRVTERARTGALVMVPESWKRVIQRVEMEVQT